MRVPTTEEVMEQLREDTIHYINVDNPIESAARRQRVLQTEEEGLMQKTASRIVAAASSKAMIYGESSRTLPEPTPQELLTPLSRECLLLFQFPLREIKVE
ncbi:unnamed protein product [Brassica rapa subsp. narinosa]|uniref:Uncharacterized protein n=1 Tax=Brassica campestris TaxID=3711 RepID=M4DMI6_BRACM